ncbi:hypothetical protein [Streptomyces nodosus]|uniref:hypothetical protein n=1 Tax=Streptomyces nodosus TaxID=40318 RepID=UPI0036EBDC6D
MDLNALRFANFKLLDDAVEDWALIVRNLEQLAKDAETGLHRAANKADWSGENSQVTKEFVGKAAGEFKDAHTQAETIHNILSDTAGELKDYQRQLTGAIERGRLKNLTVMDTGKGTFTVTMNVHPDRAASGYTPPEHDENDVNALRDEVQEILRNATESDTSAKTVLTALVDQTDYGFSDASYKDRDSAAAAIKEADELAKLAEKKPEDLTLAEFDRLNAGLKKYHDDPLFSERFARDLGPEKTLSFWAGVSDPQVTPELTRERRDQLGELQKNLSLTLAAASKSDSGEMADWKRHMIEIGDQPVSGKRGGVLGFQVMSNLMRAGDYDDEFLTRYGERLMETERKFTNDGKAVAWQRLGFSPYLNHMAGDSGWDPMSGYLKGLSNSPAAATEFFSGDFIPKDDDHKHAVSNFKYLFEERHWPHESRSDFKPGESVDGHNNLAMALEAATTGHPAGEMPTADTPAHNAQQAKLMASVVHSISEDPERLTKKSYMSDSIGQMTAEYLPDINRALADIEPDPKSEHWQEIERLFPVAGASAQMSHTDVARLLIAVGQSPAGYAAVEVGQKAYMANLMDYHLNPDLPEGQRYHQSVGDTVKAIARQSAEVGGTLGIGRQEAVLGPAKEKDEAYNAAVSQMKNVTSGTISTGIGVGTSFIGSPVAGAAAYGAASTVSSVVLEELFKDVSGDHLKHAGLDAGKLWEDSRQRNIELAQCAAAKAAEAHHSPYVHNVGGWALDATKDGFNDASTNGDRMAKGLTTEIPK